MSENKSGLLSKFGWAPDYLNPILGNVNFKNNITNLDYVLMSPKTISKFNIPRITPTWIANTWSSRGGGQLV